MKTCRLSDAVLPELGSDAGKVVLIDKLYVVGEKTRFKEIDGDYAERLAKSFFGSSGRGYPSGRSGLLKSCRARVPLLVYEAREHITSIGGMLSNSLMLYCRSSTSLFSIIQFR